MIFVTVPPVSNTILIASILKSSEITFKDLSSTPLAKTLRRLTF
ncbi:MAG: hypothetical protein R3Y64_11475 [Peptostreptococcaceae bacterium]